MGRRTASLAFDGESAAVIRPGWLEILVGLVVWAALAFGVAVPLRQLDPGVHGLALNALSAVAALGGFGAATLVRIRSWGAFGIRRVSWRWLLAGVGGGVAAFLLSRVATTIYLALTGDTSDPQATYSDGAGGGPGALVLSFVFLAVATPIGEELLFRGVVTAALLRYGAVAGVVGSAVVFALAHGLNGVAVTALVVGLIAAELRRRSGSVWPGVLVHAVNNTVSSVIVFLLV
jgi:membrane protease YdiL (CAAX protease family)